jgi:hypothetical protein
MNEPFGWENAELNPALNEERSQQSGIVERRSRRNNIIIKKFIGLQAQEKIDLPPANYSWYSSLPQDKNSTWYLPFIPDFGHYESYDNWTISLNATNPSLNETQYNLHSFYGHMMAKRTSQYF